mmetsp:Transcript_4425/g.10241  ORF Transcript_4425/g.10241 Transcript_4425/m.10241 type:complete len:237 (+) Transcript_4425:53-763(+)
MRGKPLGALGEPDLLAPSAYRRHRSGPVARGLPVRAPCRPEHELQVALGFAAEPLADLRPFQARATRRQISQNISSALPQYRDAWSYDSSEVDSALWTPSAPSGPCLSPRLRPSREPPRAPPDAGRAEGCGCIKAAQGQGIGILPQSREDLTYGYGMPATSKHLPPCAAAHPMEVAPDLLPEDRYLTTYVAVHGRQVALPHEQLVGVDTKHFPRRYMPAKGRPPMGSVGWHVRRPG